MFKQCHQTPRVELFGSPVLASCSLRENYGGPLIFLDLLPKAFDFFKGQNGLLPVNQNRTSVTEIIGDTWNSVAQRCLTDELGMVFSKIPNDGRDIVCTLVIGNND